MAAAARAHFILYVRDQQASRRFWEAALATAPTLDVPGMTEFPLAEGAAGAQSLSEPAPRDWGHEVGYALDPDGHVIAFARVL